MEFPIGVAIGAVSVILAIVLGGQTIYPTTYPMMVHAEKTCYSNHGIKEVAKRSKALTVVCNNGATFEFSEGDYRND